MAAGRSATAGPRRARGNHPGPAGRRRPGHLAGQRWPARHPAVGGRGRDQPRRRPRWRRRPRAVFGDRPRPAGHRQRDDRRLRRVQFPRRPGSNSGHPDPPRHGTGHRGRMAEPPARARAPDLRGPAALRANRPGRRAARQRSRSHRHGHHHRQQHRRQNPGRLVRRRRHAGARRPADQPRGQAARRQRGHGRDRPRRPVRRRRGNRRRHRAPAIVPTGRGRAVRSGRRGGAGGRGIQPRGAHLPGPVPDGPAGARFGDRAPPGRLGLDLLARAPARRRAAHPNPGPAGHVEPAGRRRAGHAHRAEHLHPLRSGGPAPPAGGNRRRLVAHRTPRGSRRLRLRARAVQRRRHRRDRRPGRPAVGIDVRTDDRRPHRADRRPIHGAAARGHAARAEPVRTPRLPQRVGARAPGRGR